mmetsp:Transcript_25688/g.41419  ORF Transcript_25688/g.41419 Transcript_25688/m.41419 type:complete len:148 (-) Transcript_25688:2394-2837(-)
MGRNLLYSLRLSSNSEQNPKPPHDSEAFNFLWLVAKLVEDPKLAHERRCIPAHFYFKYLVVVLVEDDKNCCIEFVGFRLVNKRTRVSPLDETTHLCSGYFGCFFLVRLLFLGSFFAFIYRDKVVFCHNHCRERSPKTSDVIYTCFWS